MTQAEYDNSITNVFSSFREAKDVGDLIGRKHIMDTFFEVGRPDIEVQITISQHYLSRLEYLKRFSR